MEVASEAAAIFSDVMVGSHLVDSAFSSVDMTLQFSDRVEGPIVHCLERPSMIVCVEAAVDWREHANDDRDALLRFCLEKVGNTLFWLAKKLLLSNKAF